MAPPPAAPRTGISRAVPLHAVAAPGGGRPGLVLFTPLPPRQNGIADYAAELLPWHCTAFDVTVVLEDDHPDPVLPEAAAGRVRVVRLGEYLADPDAWRGQIHLYHLGNNRDHVYMLDPMMRAPGVVVLHDASLHHLMDCATLGQGRPAAYGALLEREYAAQGALLARQFEAFGWRGRSLFYELPLVRTLLGRARAVVTHSAFAWTKARAAAPDTPVERIPHHLSPSVLRWDGLGRGEARQALKLPADGLVLVSLGFINGAKQIGAVLRALMRLRAGLPPFTYVLAGESLPEQYDVEGEIARLGLGDLVRVTGFLGEDDFFRHIAAADLVVNLRYPTGGETSGTLVRAMGAGACVLVNDYGPFAELPDDACVKVPWSPRFEEDLEGALAAILADPERRRQTGARARARVRERHAVSRSAEAYRRLLLRAGAGPRRPWGVERPHELLTLPGIERLIAGAGAPPTGMLWAREGFVPVAAEGSGDLALCAGRPALQRPWLGRFGWGAERICEIPPPAAPRAAPPARDCAAALLAAEAPTPARLSAALAVLNARLAFGGLLVVDLTDGPGRPDGGAGAVERVIAAAGFRLLRAAVGGPSDVSPAPAADGDPSCEACWLAVKVSEHLSGLIPLPDPGPRAGLSPPPREVLPLTTRVVATACPDPRAMDGKPAARAVPQA